MWWSIATPCIPNSFKIIAQSSVKTRKEVSILNGSGIFHLLFSPGKKVKRLEKSFQVLDLRRPHTWTQGHILSACLILATSQQVRSPWQGAGQVAPLDSLSWEPHWPWVFPLRNTVACGEVKNCSHLRIFSLIFLYLPQGISLTSEAFMKCSCSGSDFHDFSCFCCHRWQSTCVEVSCLQPNFF